MFDESHLSDQDLLAWSDGELSGRRATQVQAHLASCWSCRARGHEMENTITAFVAARERAATSELPPVHTSRVLLQARVAEEAVASKPRAWRPMAASIAAASVCALLGFFAIRQSIVSRHHEGIAVPLASLTPGAVRSVTRADVCSAGTGASNGMVPIEVQERVFREYGIANARPADYEVDYLITPALGGSNDIRNLWPQSYSAVWNARVKDELEDRLRSLVCEGKLELAVAQRDIALDWISAYKKYFHTDRPLSKGRG